MNVENAQLSMNIFDAIVIGVFLLSAVVAFFRGFVREVLSLGAWVGAAFITMYLFPQSTQFMKAHVKSDHLAAGSAALGTYLCALLTLSLLNSVIIRYLKTGSEVGIIDNVLGLGFGALRGAFIVSLAYLIIASVVSKDNPPVWLKTSVTKAYLQEGSVLIAKAAPRYLTELNKIIDKQKNKQPGANPSVNGNEGEEEGASPTVIRGGEGTGEKEVDTEGAMRRLMNTMHTPKEGSQNDAR